jgi:hypothetical protein
MGALVLVDPGSESRTGTRRRMAVPLLLVAGWIGLFAYSAAYLTEDLPFRPQATEAVPPGQPFATGIPTARGRRVVMLDMPDESAPSTAQPASAPRAPVPAAAPPSSVAAATSPPAVAPLPRQPTLATAGADHVGLWGPTPDACGARSRRRGFLPATITQDHAQAGRTLCTFRDGHRVGAAWVVAAECSDRGRHWSSQVRLTVDGDRLTWSSGRGTSTYVRCGRRTG